MSQADVQTVECAGGCKRSVPTPDAAEKASWDYLPISRRWRCLPCWRELQQVNKTKEEK